MESDRVARMQGWGLTMLRVVVGIVFLAHGLQKLFVMGFGGVAGMMEGLAVPAPGLFAVVLTLVELLGGLALIVGLFTRVAAIPLAVDMLVATLTRCTCRTASSPYLTAGTSSPWCSWLPA